MSLYGYLVFFTTFVLQFSSFLFYVFRLWLWFTLYLSSQPALVEFDRFSWPRTTRSCGFAAIILHRESTSFTSKGSLVRVQLSPLKNPVSVQNQRLPDFFTYRYANGVRKCQKSAYPNGRVVHINHRPLVWLSSELTAVSHIEIFSIIELFNQFQ